MPQSTTFYPETLQKEILKVQVARNFFVNFYYKPLECIDFSLKHKDDSLGIHHIFGQRQRQAEATQRRLKSPQVL